MKGLVKPSAAVAVILVLVLALAGCGSGEDSLKKVNERGKLLVGMEASYSGAMKEFEEELAAKLSEKLDVEVEIVDVTVNDGDSLLNELDKDEPCCDILMSEIAPRPELSDNYLVSLPYVEKIGDPYVLVVHEDNSSIKSFKDISGKMAANVLGTIEGEMANESGARLIESNLKQAVMLIENGAADCMVVSLSDYKKLEGDIKKVAEYAPENIYEIQCAAVMKKDAVSLHEEINKAIEELIDDGSAKKLAEAHFGAKYAEKISIYN